MTTAFSMGQLILTKGVADQIEESRDFAAFVKKCLRRYITCDWGELSEDDKKLNDAALKHNDDRILAAYIPPEHPDWKIWIITEWDHSATTILFPREY